MPYTHGGLVSRVHADGEVLSEEHTGDGTLLKARVHEELAADLAPFIRWPERPGSRDAPAAPTVNRRRARPALSGGAGGPRCRPGRLSRLLPANFLLTPS